MMTKLKYDCLNVLSSCELPWITYLIEKNIEGSDDEKLKQSMMNDKRIKAIIQDCLDWPSQPIRRHNDASHAIHKLCLLADFGFDHTFPVIQQIAEKIFFHQDENGAFLSLINIPKVFGGDDRDQMAWIICDFPTLLYALIRFGYKDHPQVKKGISFLKGLCDDNGWRCVSAFEKFRGPGRKADHCPYGNLIALKVFSLLPEFHDEPFIKRGIQAFFDMWAVKGERKFFMFGIGTDFKKLKYPNLWFEIVHVMRVLSRFEEAKKHPAFGDMLNIISAKQQENGGFIPESIYMAYKGWDFGQKKEVSYMLTYYIWDLFKTAKSV